MDSYAIQVEGTSMGLSQGDIVTRRALLYGILLPSGNDAANAAAVSVSGSMGKFVELMNKKRRNWGLSTLILPIHPDLTHRDTSPPPMIWQY